MHWSRKIEMNMPDGNTAALDRWEAEQDSATDEYERKLAEFRRDPYSYCEWNIDAFGKYAMLDVVLDALLDEVDTQAAADFRPNQCSRKDLMAAIRDSIDKVEL